MNLGRESSPERPMACGPFSECAGAVGMHLDGGTVERSHLDFEVDQVPPAFSSLRIGAKFGGNAHCGDGVFPLAWETSIQHFHSLLFDLEKTALVTRHRGIDGAIIGG